MLRQSNLFKPLSLVLLLALMACQGGPAPTSPQGNPAGMAGANVPSGMGVIKGRVQIDASGAGSIAAGANYRLSQAPSATGGTVTARGDLDTKEVPVGPDGEFSIVVPGGGEYILEASVPDGKGGLTRAVSPPISVPLAQDPPIVDAASLVTRRTGSIQGLIELKDAKEGETPEGADVFLSGGTSVVGKAGETGRFALTNVAEGTWNVVIAKPGYKRQIIKGVVVRAGRPSLLDATVVLERESQQQQAGVVGAVQTTDGQAIVGATVSLYPKDRRAIAAADGGLDNFTAVTNDEGRYEILNLPPGDYTVQVYRPFYRLPARRSVTVAPGASQDLGVTQLTSTTIYFCRLAGSVKDENGQPIDGAVVQLEPPVTEAQFADAAGNFTLDRILPGEYQLSIAAGGYVPVIIPILIDNKPNCAITLPTGVVLGEEGSLNPITPPIVPIEDEPVPTPPPVIVTPPPIPSPSPSVEPTPSPEPTPTVPIVSGPTPTPEPTPTPTPIPTPRVEIFKVETLAGSTKGYADGVGEAAKFKNPAGVAVDASGTIYVSDEGNNRIRTIQSDLAVTTLAGSFPGSKDGKGTLAWLQGPVGLTMDEARNLTVADWRNNRIRQISSFADVTTLAGEAAGYQDEVGRKARFRGPTAVALDAAGNVFVADTENHRIRKVTQDGTVTTFAGSIPGYKDGAGTAAQFTSPTGLSFDMAGNLYVADRENHVIRRISPAGEVSTYAGSPKAMGHIDANNPLEARFNAPYGVVVRGDGAVFVTEIGNHCVRKIDPDGRVMTAAGSTAGFKDGIGIAAQFNSPQGIAIDGEGNLYVADRLNQRVRRVSLEP